MLPQKRKRSESNRSAEDNAARINRSGTIIAALIAAAALLLSVVLQTRNERGEFQPILVVAAQYLSTCNCATPQIVIVTATPPSEVPTQIITDPILTAEATDIPYTPTAVAVSGRSCETSERMPIDASSGQLISGWRTPNAAQIQIRIPEGYSSLWVSSDAGIFNGRRVNTRVAIVSEVDLTVQGVGFNTEDGHYNVWAVAFDDCTASEIFANPMYGFDGADAAFTIDASGEMSSYPVP